MAEAVDFGYSGGSVRPPTPALERWLHIQKTRQIQLAEAQALLEEADENVADERAQIAADDELLARQAAEEADAEPAKKGKGK